MATDFFPLPPRGATEGECEALFEPINASALEAVCKEQRWGLPSDYCRFLLKWNGFQLTGKSLVFSRNEARDELRDKVVPYCGYDECIEVFYGIGGGCNDLRFAQGSYFFGELLDVGPYVNIGYGVNNHVLCMSLNKSDYGTIYSWESFEGSCDSPREMLVYNAVSFRYLWEMCRAIEL